MIIGMMKGMRRMDGDLMINNSKNMVVVERGMDVSRCGGFTVMATVDTERTWFGFGLDILVLMHMDGMVLQ
jgi:hypothetical protein